MKIKDLNDNQLKKIAKNGHCPWLYAAAVLIELALVGIAALLITGSLRAISRAQVERVPMPGIPSIDAGIYPDAHVEEAK